MAKPSSFSIKTTKGKIMKCIPPKPNPRCTKVPSEELKTLTDIIIHYQKECSEKAYLKMRKKIPYDSNHCCNFMHDDLNEILNLKGKDTEKIFLRCVRNTKRHQAHILKSNAEKAVKKLMNNPMLYPFSSTSCNNFEDLYDQIKTTIGRNEKDQEKIGIGNSTIYDTCIRLGWSYTPKIIPEQYVYIHGKLIESAKAILGIKRLYTKATGRPAILRQEFINTEPEFEKLSALDIENLLCIYHDDILTVKGIKPKKQKKHKKARQATPDTPNP